MELASGILVQGASLILQAGLGITIFIGTVLITGGKIELLPLLVLLMFSTQIYGPILAILSQLTSLFHLETVTNRMRTLLTTPAMEGEDKDVSKYDIELKNVTFGYNQDDVIKDVSFFYSCWQRNGPGRAFRQRQKHDFQTDRPLLGI